MMPTTPSDAREDTTGSAIDVRRAESAHQHVRALNTQFASWVKLQLQNHPDELWEDGVRDYLVHASNIMEKFSDVVAWLRANTAKEETIVPTYDLGLTSHEKNLLPETENMKSESEVEVRFIQNGTASSIPSFCSSPLRQGQSFIKATVDANFVQNKVPTSVDSDENDLDQPSSPSLRKTEEKGVSVVHQVKCKVYVKPENPADKGWKDMGMGMLSIKCKEDAVKASKESKPIIIVRNDVGRILLNASIYPGIKMNVQKNTVTSIFHTTSFDVANEDKPGDVAAIARTYLLRTKNEEEARKLVAAIEEHAPAA